MISHISIDIKPATNPHKVAFGAVSLKVSSDRKGSYEKSVNYQIDFFRWQAFITVDTKHLTPPSTATPKMVYRVIHNPVEPFLVRFPK